MTDVPTLTEVTTTVDTGSDPDPILGAVPGTKEDVTSSLYRAAIGPLCQDFYLPIFSRFEETGEPGISWNSAASLLTFNWLLFRQLWTAALAYVGILAAVGLLVFGIGRLVFEMSDAVAVVLMLLLGVTAFVVPGLFGNILLHKQCRARMEKALADNPTLAEATTQLKRQASSRKRLLWLLVGNLVVVGLSTLAYFHLPTLTTMNAMPQGAIEARQMVAGRASRMASPGAGASAAVMGPSAPSAPSASQVATPPAPAALAPPASEPAASASAGAAIQMASSAPAASASNAKEPAPAPPPSLTASQAPTVAAPTERVAAHRAPASAKSHKVTKKATAPKTVTKTAAAGPSAQELFYINVGLFSKPENASRVHTQLLEAHMPSVMKELKTKKARQIRVRVGPYATESQAEAAAEKIKGMQFDAGIIQK